MRPEVVVPEWERDHPLKPGEREAAVLDVAVMVPPNWALEFVDIHVYHCFTGAGVRASRPSAQAHERLKDERYTSRTAEGTRAVPFSLVPFVFNVYGGLGPRGHEALKRWRAVAPRQGTLSQSFLPNLALRVVRRAAAQVLSACYGHGSRLTSSDRVPS